MKTANDLLLTVAKANEANKGFQHIDLGSSGTPMSKAMDNLEELSLVEMRIPEGQTGYWLTKKGQNIVEFLRGNA